MQPIFSGNPDFNKTAFLNWRFDSGSDILHLLNLAEGYLDSGISLTKSCIMDNEDKQADILIFPILTNVNHGIELYLKAMIWALNKLLNSPGRIEGKHNILQIYHSVSGKIKDYGKPSIKEFNSSTKELRAYLIELFEKVESDPKDDKMDFSRYPLSDEYDNHFYVNSLSNVEIDLENFLSRIEIIKERLQMITDFLFYQELNQDW